MHSAFWLGIALLGSALLGGNGLLMLTILPAIALTMIRIFDTFRSFAVSSSLFHSITSCFYGMTSIQHIQFSSARTILGVPNGNDWFQKQASRTLDIACSPITCTLFSPVTSTLCS
ncbi:hypothetical protein L484_007344 [Morus notabilis]|uniref:Uncharacterized protein n=1 Tax=Morus notabilis TaxID=981085 RepID=W9R332_9ROSA|nr:hypothetical protein L484_007344 [Morus notabilis]